jgi:hypothetical protein
MTVPLECWDRARALDSVGGDEEFLRELAGIFCAACPTLLGSLEASITIKDSLSAADTARLLGRAARNLAANKATEAAIAVETMARRDEFDGIDAAFYALRVETERLLSVLIDFRSGQSKPPGPTTA